MTVKPRVFLDTNILVSGMVFAGEREKIAGRDHQWKIGSGVER